MRKDADKFQLAKLAIADVIFLALEQVLDIMRAERSDTIKQAWSHVDTSMARWSFQRAAHLAAMAEGKEHAIKRLEFEKGSNQVWMDEFAAACVEAVLKEYKNDNH